jgi:hypothetical protein
VSMRHSRQHVLVHLSKSAQYRELCGARMQHGQDKLTVICSRGETCTHDFACDYVSKALETLQLPVSSGKHGSLVRVRSEILLLMMLMKFS